VAQRQAAAELTMGAVKERSAGNNDEAIRLARLALVFDPTNTAASGIAEELEALKRAPIASAAPPPPPRPPAKGPRPASTPAPSPPPATKTAAPDDKGGKGDKGDKGDKGWL
jgi:hypothetical protein